jgi:signal transduction histidine kinase
VKIVVEIVPKDENTYLEIQVIDTGIGIKEED